MECNNSCLTRSFFKYNSESCIFIRCWGSVPDFYNIHTISNSFTHLLTYFHSFTHLLTYFHSFIHNYYLIFTRLQGRRTKLSEERCGEMSPFTGKNFPFSLKFPLVPLKFPSTLKFQLSPLKFYLILE